MKKYNCIRTLESFEEPLKIIKEHGYKPIAVAQMYFEDVFIFETKDEAEKARQELDMDKAIVGGYWWDKPTFLQQAEKYKQECIEHNLKYPDLFEKEEHSEVFTIWLKD